MIEMDSPDGINLFTQMIREIVRQEIKNAAFNKMLPAIVVSADNVAKTATVKLASDDTEITDVKNRTNQNLSTNDLIYVLFINGSSSNYCALIKF